MESTNDRRDDVNIITQSLPVPDYKIGWIIGKKGTYINQLARKSGAQIAVTDSKSKEYGTVWKYVQITGTGRAIDRAKKLIHIRLERLEPRDDMLGNGNDNSNGNGSSSSGNGNNSSSNGNGDMNPEITLSVDNDVAKT